MNETDAPNSESEHNSDDWKSWPPKDFLSNMLHELRTPLMMIKGYVAILSNEEAKEHHPQALESINFSVGRIEQLYEDIAIYLGELMRKS
jgi:signal transduction histidine kinase